MQNVRRRTNGTIDIDAYRQEALLLRTQNRTEFFKRAAFVARPFIGLMAAVAVLTLLRPLLPAAAADMPGAIAAAVAAHTSFSSNHSEPIRRAQDADRQ